MTDLPVRTDIPYDPGFRVADAQRMARRARYIADQLPYLATDPNNLLRLAQSPLDPERMGEQAAAMAGLNNASEEKTTVEGLSPSAQRAYWENLPPARQQALVSLGYQLPVSETSQVPGSDFLRGIASPVGAAWEGLYTAGSTTLGYGLAGLQEAGEIPMEMYREIRQQPEWVQLLALGVAAGVTGGLAVGALGAGVGAFATLGGMAGVSGAAFGGLAAGYGAAGIAATLTGNPGYWASTFSLGREAGEADFLPGAMRRAVEILDDDGQVYSLAQRFALDGDPVSTILKEFGSEHDATSETSMQRVAHELVADTLGLTPGTAEYMEAMDSVMKLTGAPQFRLAVAHLQSQKISMGRDVARIFGLDADDGLGKLVSGGTDALSWFLLDPVLAAGKIAKTARAFKYGVSTGLRGEQLATIAADESIVSQIARKGQDRAVRRQLDDLAVYLEADAPEQLFNAVPDAARLWGPMKSWEAAYRAFHPKEAFSWDADRILQFLTEQAGLQALAAGRGAAFRHGMIEMPHVSRVGRKLQNTRLNLMNIVSRWDDTNISHRIPLGPDALKPEYIMGRKVLPTVTPDERIWTGANAVIDLVDDIPVLRNVIHPASTLAVTMLTKIPSHGFIPLTHETQMGGDMVAEITNFTRLGRVMGVPRTVTDEWARIILTGKNVGERRQAVDYFYRTLFKAVGVEDTAEGVELTDRFILHAHQAYSEPGKLGVFLSDSSPLMAIPDLRQLRKAAIDNTLWNKILNAADAPVFDLAVAKIWKPAVLLRIGFVTRAVGDELLSWLAREGPYGWVASSMARSIVDEDPVASHVRWIDLGWQKLRPRNVAPGDLGVESFLRTGVFPHLVTDMDRVSIAFLERYSIWLRSVAKHGLIGLDANRNWMTRWAGKPGTLRGLVLSGVDDTYLEAARVWAGSPALQASVMRELSSGRSVMASAVQGLNGPDQVLHGTSLEDADYAELVQAGGKGFREIDQADRGASFDSMRRQASTWHGDGEILEPVADELANFVDPKVFNALNQGGALETITEAVEVPALAQRQFLWNILMDDDADRWQALVNRLDHDDPIALAWNSAPRRASSETKLRLVADYADEVMPETGWGDLIRRMMDLSSADPAMRNWAVRAIDKGVLPELRTGWSQGEIFDAATKTIRTELARPGASERISRMEYGNKGAVSGIPLAKPLPPEQMRLFVAYAPQQVFDQIRGLGPTELKEFFGRRGIPLDDETLKYLSDALDVTRPVPTTSLAGMGGPVPLMGNAVFDPAVAHKAGAALADVANLRDVSVYGELVVPSTLTSHLDSNIPFVRSRTEKGYNIDPFSGPTPNDVSPIAGMHQVAPGNGVVVIDEYATDVTDAVRSLGRIRDQLTDAERARLDEINEWITSGDTVGYTDLNAEFDFGIIQGSADGDFGHAEFWAAQEMNEMTAHVADMTKKYSRTPEYVPGLSYEQVLDELSEVYGRSFIDRYFSRGNIGYTADDAPVEMLAASPTPDPVDYYDELAEGTMGPPAPDMEANGHAVYKGVSFEVSTSPGRARVETRHSLAYADEYRSDPQRFPNDESYDDFFENQVLPEVKAMPLDDAERKVVEDIEKLVERGKNPELIGWHPIDPQEFEAGYFESGANMEMDVIGYHAEIAAVRESYVLNQNLLDIIDKHTAPKGKVRQERTLAALTETDPEFGPMVTDTERLTREGFPTIEGSTITYDPKIVEYDFNRNMDAIFTDLGDEAMLIGLSPEVLAERLDAEGYRDLVLGTWVRIAAGESPEVALKGQARWADVLPQPGSLAPADQPIRRVLWETVGPISVEYDMLRHNQGLWLEKHGFDEAGQATTRSERIPVATTKLAGLVNSEDLPAQIMQKVSVAREESLGAWDRTVRYGFRKVIGPMIDALIREPLAFHNFARAYTDAKRMSVWWLDQSIFGVAEGFDEVVQADGSTRLIPRNEGSFVKTARRWNERDVRTSTDSLTPRERTFVVRTLADLDLADADMPFEEAMRIFSGNRESVLAEIKEFAGRPTKGVPRRVATRDAEVRENAKKLHELLEGRRTPLTAEQSQDLLLTWWRNASRDPDLRRVIDDLEDADRNVRRRAAARLSRKLPGSDLSPTEIRAVKRAAENMAHVDELVMSTAQERAIVDTIPFIDRDNVRAQFQEYVRNLVPFWFAEDQFMRRWARTAAHSPEMVRKAQLLYSGLRSGGVIQTDVNGDDYYVYPGSSVLAEVIGNIPFFGDKLPIATALTGQVKYSLPGLDRFGVPQVSPLVGVPMNAVVNVFPELQPVQAALQGERGGSTGVIRSVLPTSVMRFYDAIMADDGDRKLASAMQTAVQVLEANGYGMPDNATADQMDHYIDRIRSQARSILLAQALFGFVAPASPAYQVVGEEGRSLPWYDVRALTGVSSPNVLLTDEYIKFVQELGVEKGTQEFLARYPDGTPDDMINTNIAYRVGRTKSASGAPLPPLRSAMDFYDANRTWMDQNPTAAAWLLPPAENEDDAQSRDLNAYMEQQALHLRKRKSPEEFIRDLKFATASGPYFDIQEAYDTKIAATVDPVERNLAETAKAMWQSSYLATHPLFAEELQSGEGRARRNLVLDSLRLAFADPATPTPWHAPGLKTILDGYDNYRAAMIELSADQSKRTKELRENLRRAFDDWGTNIVSMRPELVSFWNGVVRIEARV